MRLLSASVGACCLHRWAQGKLNRAESGASSSSNNSNSDASRRYRRDVERVRELDVGVRLEPTSDTGASARPSHASSAGLQGTVSSSGTATATDGRSARSSSRTSSYVLTGVRVDHLLALCVMRAFAACYFAAHAMQVRQGGPRVSACARLRAGQNRVPSKVALDPTSPPSQC